MPRILGVDLGSVRIGLALSDPSGVIAQGLEVVDVTSTPPVDAVVARVKEHEVDEIVVGIPTRMDGSVGPEAENAEAFARALEKATGLPVTRWDERLSTKEAVRSMRAAGADSRKQRGVIDKIAAALFLQAYLESRRS
ncbi:MAG: Holliday junction resolvase RuvX [Actinomycetota bacterium]